MLDDFRIRFRALFRRNAADRELDDEMQFHLEHLRDKYIASGLSVADATRRARLEFGGVEQVKEECREARGVALLETVVQDTRYGVRMLRRTPLFSLTAVGTIALSTAALATVFILVHSLFLRKMPVPDPDELIVVSATRGRPSDGLVAYPDYLSFRDRATTTAMLAAYYPTAPLFVSANGHAREINGAVVSANFFPMLRLAPPLGRFFRPDEDEVPDRDRVAILSDALWRTWFGASNDAIGAAVRINGADFVVIGVAPPASLGLTPSPIEIYIPTMMLRVGYRWCDNAFAPDCQILRMMGRLQPGKTIADAAAEFPTLAPAAWARAPVGQNRGVAVTAPRGQSLDSDDPAFVRMLGLDAAVLLLVCCANLTGLLMARSVTRSGEFTIRRALGAASGRIVRQILTECLLIGAAGGVAGIALSRLFIALIGTMFFAMDDEGHALQYDFTLTPGIVEATMAAALAAGLLFGILPALKATRQPTAVPAAPRSSIRRWSSTPWLLGGQAAAAVVLVSLGLLLSTNAHTMLAGRNVDSSHVALMRVRPRLVKYAPERAQRFQRDALQRLGAVPSVESVSMVGVGAVLGGSSNTVALPEWTADQSLHVNYNEIGPRYFETLATPLVAGREFDDRDTSNAPPVAIVNETLAARLWSDGRALGATLLVATRAHQVVGVVKDVNLNGRTKPAQSWAYVPFWQNPGQVDARLAIRVAGDPAAALPALVEAVHQIDPDVPIAETITLPIQLAGLARPLRVSATFIACTAALALLLTAIGLYGALAFSVASRTREIGIRIALGAKRGWVVAGIVRQGMTAVAIGTVCGVLLAPGATRLVTHLLVRSAVGDWLFYTVGVAVVGSVGALASWLPARRAARVEPIVALRCE
jgi:putative ABC transport system permease protein